MSFASCNATKVQRSGTRIRSSPNACAIAQVRTGCYYYSTRLVFLPSFPSGPPDQALQNMPCTFFHHLMLYRSNMRCSTRGSGGTRLYFDSGAALAVAASY